MGIADLVNLFLNRFRLELRRLPRRKAAERSRSPKMVFFVGPGRMEHRDLVETWHVCSRSLPGRLKYIASPRGVRRTRQNNLTACSGTIDPRGCIWTPGDYAILLTGEDLESTAAAKALPILESYLHALGAGAVGWIFPPPPLHHPDPWVASRIRLALQRSRVVYCLNRKTADLIRKEAGEGVGCSIVQPSDLWGATLPPLPRYPGRKVLGRISLVATCKGRLEQLKTTISGCLAQEDDNFEYLVVDYDCPQDTAGWLRGRGDERIVAVKIRNKPFFDQSHARNLGGRFASGSILVFIDADTVLEPGFLSSVRRRLNKGTFLVTSMVLTGEKDYGSGAGLLGYGGIIACWKKDWEGVRGFDETMRGWGGEDDDFRKRLRAAGLTPVLFDLSLCRALDHDENSRTEFYREKSKGATARANLERGEDPLRPLPAEFGLGDAESPIEIFYRRSPSGNES